MASRAVPFSQPSTATILVVDDEAFVRIILAEALTDAGYIALEAESIEVAIGMLETHPNIDVLITDVNLDNAHDGHFLALRAYNLFPAVKIILMSGDIITSEALRDKPSLASGVLLKPFRLEEMWCLVESLLSAPDLQDGPVPGAPKDCRPQLEA